MLTLHVPLKLKLTVMETPAETAGHERWGKFMAKGIIYKNMRDYMDLYKSNSKAGQQKCQ